MNRFHAPDDSVTEQSVRMAFNYEYMVPIEVAWELEQRLNRATAECERLRFVSRSQDKAFDHLAQTCGKLARREAGRATNQPQISTELANESSR